MIVKDRVLKILTQGQYIFLHPSLTGDHELFDLCIMQQCGMVKLHFQTLLKVD
jgi:hypothetical protein